MHTCPRGIAGICNYDWFTPGIEGDKEWRIVLQFTWDRQIARKVVDHYRPVILVAIVAVVVVAVYVNSHPLQMGNNTTLVVEVGVGIIIAIIVYGRSRKNERKMEKVVYDIQEIVQGEQSTRDKLSRIVTEDLLDCLGAISKDAAQIGSMSSPSVRQNVGERPGADQTSLIQKIFLQSQNIEHMKPVLYPCIPDQARNIIALVDLCESLQKGGNMTVCATIKKKADELIQDLDVRAVDNGHASQTTVGDQTLSITPDRREYPIGSTVHVRTQLSTSTTSKDIRYKVVDTRRKVVYDSTISLANWPDMEEVRRGMLNHKIQLKGRKWKVNRKYDVTVSQGDSSATARFSIVQRTPIIETDQDVYMAGSDMIITVIDPDSNKDTFKEEYVGDDDNSKLVIVSDRGKIDGYRLRETGKSTGIFQGIVGILRARADGSVVCHEFGGKKINRTQGTGIEDGFIVCERGGDIRIRYTSPSGSVSYTVFASNYGAALELDRSAYPCTGRVHITVIAPDQGLDSERRDTIGDDRECKLSVRTGLGRINGYRLVESGKDTGIFKGSIALTGFAGGTCTGPDAIPRGTTGGDPGPDGGLLACSHEDELEVELTMGAGDVYTRRASIRWNVGRIAFFKNVYDMGARAVVQVVDPDMIANHDEPNSLTVHISSGSDKAGFDMIAREESPGTGVFKGNFLVDATGSPSSGAKIQACYGDTIEAKYVDATLPPPYGPHDKIAIAASARVLTADGDLPPLPQERIELAKVTVQSGRGGRRQIMEGDDALIVVDATHVDGPSTFAAIVNACDSSGVELDLLVATMDAKHDGSARHAFRWTPPSAGVFHITVHLWESLERPVPLCAAVTQSVNVISGDQDHGN